MKRPRYIVWMFTVFLTVLVAYLIYYEQEWKGQVLLSVTLSSDEHAQEVMCWKDDTGRADNTYYVFLPGYARLKEATIRTHNTAFVSVSLDGKTVAQGMKLDGFQLNTPYELLYRTRGGTYAYTLIFLQSANVAALHIDTTSGTMDHVHEKKGNEEPGRIALYHADGALAYSGALDQIKGRGNSTWTNPKKPYNFKLSQEADLLGMGKAQNWVLLAEYSDESYMKNKIAYDFARTVGMAYSPDSDWVDLYLNGEYAGLYLLCEHVEIHPERLNIAKENSFLISVDGTERLKSQGLPYIELDYGRSLRLRYADMRAEDVEAIWRSAQNAILSEDGIDPVSQKSWQELIDMDSWAQRYLMDEVFGNYDGGFISQFFYYNGQDASGKLYAGPVWDMDLTLGVNGYIWQISSPRTLQAGRPHLNIEKDQPLFYRLCQKEEFHARMTELYQTTFLPALSRLLDEGLDEYAAKIKQAAQMDAVHWNSDDFTVSTAYNRRYLEERIAFLNDLWLEGGEYHFVQVNPSDSNVFGCFALKSGEVLPELPQEAGYGWYRYDTDAPFDVTQPIYEDVSIYRAVLPEAEYAQP